MKNRALGGLLGVGIIAATVALALPTASAAPRQCGGQGAAPQPVPYTCTLPPQTIAGSEVSGTVSADGNALTVTYNLAAPRTDDAPIRVVFHVGNSGAGGVESDKSSVILAGSTTATLVLVAPCQVGQVDVKFWFTGNGESKGRVGGPTIENGTNCTETTTTVVSTTTPGQETTTPTTSGLTSVTIPATGRDSHRLRNIALGLTAIGVMALAAGSGRILGRKEQ